VGRGGGYARNILWSAADYGLQLLFWFAATPLLVDALGAPRYGVWMLAQAIIGFSWVFSFGIGDGIIRYVSRLRGGGRDSEVPRLLQSAVAVQAGLGVLAGGVVALAAPWVASEFVQEGPVSWLETAQALRIAGLGIFVRFVDGCLTSSHYAYQRYDLPALVNIPTAALILGGSILLAKGGSGVPALLLLAVSVGTVGVLAKALMLRTLVGVDFLRPVRLALGPVQQILRFGYFVWLQGVAWAFLTQADRLLIAALRGPADLTYYVIPFQAATQIQTVLTRTFGFIFPLFSSRQASGDTGGMHRALLKTLDLTTVAAAGIGVPLVVFAGPLLARWLGEDFSQHSTVPLQILASVFLVSSISTGPFYFLNATGRERLNAWLSIASALVVTVMTAVLLPRYGILGAAAAKVLMIPTGIVALVTVCPAHIHSARLLIWVLLPVLLVAGVSLSYGHVLIPVSLSWPALALLGVAVGSVVSLFVFGFRRTIARLIPEVPR
jgi:O-antigen/teichoic acid export membrane protein